MQLVRFPILNSARLRLRRSEAMALFAMSIDCRGTERNPKTHWRRTQSRANFTPAKFLTNRGIHRESRTLDPCPSEISPVQGARWEASSAEAVLPRKRLTPGKSEY
jgi:hypothetical protein